MQYRKKWNSRVCGGSDNQVYTISMRYTHHVWALSLNWKYDLSARCSITDIAGAAAGAVFDDNDGVDNKGENYDDDDGSGVGREFLAMF